MDAGQIVAGCLARHGVDLRRRLLNRRHLTPRLRRTEPGQTPRHRRQHRLPRRADGISGSARPQCGIPVQGLRQLRAARSDRCAALGAAQHRWLRRRPAPGDDLWRVGGRHLSEHSRGLASRARTLSRRDLRKRWLFRPDAHTAGTRREPPDAAQCRAAGSRPGDTTRRQLPAAAAGAARRDGPECRLGRGDVLAGARWSRHHR